MPLFSGWVILFQEEGGGGSKAKKDCVPKFDLQVRAPLIKFLFFPEAKFSYVGGWGVGSATIPGGPI